MLRTVSRVRLDELTCRHIAVAVHPDTGLQEVAQAVALGQERINDSALPRGKDEIPAFVGDFAEELLRAQQRPVQNPASFRPHQVSAKIWNSLRRRRRLISHNRYSPLPRAHIALQTHPEPRIGRNENIEVALDLERTCSPFLLRI